MFYVYVLRSQKDQKLYTGYTNDLKRRISEHNSGENFSTSPRTPFALIYYEAYINRNDAKNREKFLKTGWGRNKKKKVLKNYYSKT